MRLRVLRESAVSDWYIRFQRLMVSTFQRHGVDFDPTLGRGLRDASRLLRVKQFYCIQQRVDRIIPSWPSLFPHFARQSPKVFLQTDSLTSWH